MVSGLPTKASTLIMLVFFEDVVFGQVGFLEGELGEGVECLQAVGCAATEVD